MEYQEIYELLEEKTKLYNQPGFIPADPVSIPHRFTKKQDIEIAGFWAAVLAWGQRKTIINKCRQLFEMMDDSPYDFVMNHSESDLKPLLDFKHRTFNDVDTLYFVSFFRHFYEKNDTLENAFTVGLKPEDPDMKNALVAFHDNFCSLPHFPHRTRKHIATPARKSACKRINMFLRWMVRDDGAGVDFGIWNNIKPSQLVCPCDVHVERVARKLGLVKRKQTDWAMATELTDNLKEFDSEDPVKYDFALFGLGVEGEM
ncbi:TIGR02757 family protein [Fulvitalea axinellae]|uniref:TIGR02757 family protein n=1 Tax=Fulvitalea axinellae TaxID=1182444 RepID=A0AAU9CKE5_9BACT|nr:TIGR02757 family protein [Fulvitalea axinellae]